MAVRNFVAKKFIGATVNVLLVSQQVCTKENRNGEGSLHDNCIDHHEMHLCLVQRTMLKRSLHEGCSKTIQRTFAKKYC